MSRAPALLSLLVASLLAACGACASAPGAPGDTASSRTVAARPSPDAQLETAALRTETGQGPDEASPWAGCEEYKDLIECPAGSVAVTRFKDSVKSVEDAHEWFEGSTFKAVELDGVPRGSAFVRDLGSNESYAASAEKLWYLVGDLAESGRVTQFKCWSRTGYQPSEKFCPMAAANFAAGTLPTNLPARDSKQVEIFGDLTPVFEDAYSPGYGTLRWRSGAAHIVPFDNKAAALAAREKALAYAKSYTSLDLYDFRCSVAGVEGDCVLAQASVGSTGRVVRTMAGALHAPSGWHLFACELRTQLDVLEDKYEASCGTLVEILPAE